MLGWAILLSWVLALLLVASTAALFGLGDIASIAMEIAKVIFLGAIILFVFIVLIQYAAIAIIGLTQGRLPSPSRPLKPPRRVVTDRQIAISDASRG